MRLREFERGELLRECYLCYDFLLSMVGGGQRLGLREMG